ncbi:MAG: FHA domain-containing serine/threonine-protein kinase [Polyangiales bacterium]
MTGADDLPPGARVAGRYAVVRRLGRGSAKVVYLAEDLLARRPVALALLAPRDDADPTLGPRFSREARAAAALTSRHAVRVLDVGKTSDGLRYLATEAVLGRGLDEAVASGPAPPLAAAVWTAEVLAALEEAHGRGILHRDVKPENVLLAPDPSHPAGEAARLTDFGLAKVLDAALEGSVILRTAQGAVMGTADYMPPEQWAGGPVDPRADLYAAGAMLYELLTGRCPFRGETLRELCAAHLTAPVPPFGGDVPDAARAFEHVARRALAKRPGDRYRGADEMRAALEAAGGFAVDAGPARGVAGEGEVFARAEMVTDAGVGPVQILLAPRVVLGRAGHAVVRCVPFSPENDARARTLSRRHAALEWRGGAAFARDLGSASGTTVNGRRVAPGGEAPLRDGDVVALGPHVRLRFEQAFAEAGVLPEWARLTRDDPYGAGLVHLLVLGAAEVSAAPWAAVRLPAERARGERAVLAAAGGDLTVTAGGRTAPLRDGTAARVGDVTLTFARETATLG